MLPEDVAVSLIPYPVIVSNSHSFFHTILYTHNGHERTSLPAGSATATATATIFDVASIDHRDL